jgi:glycosyltransferase involved in cell wall biosynthesis
MKIVYTIHQFFPRYYTGTERYLLNLAKMMKKFGHEVKIVTYMPHTEGEENLRYEGNLAIKEYIYDDINVTGIRFLGNEDYISFDFDNDDIHQFFTQYLTKEKPDILHITHPMRMTAAFPAAKDLKMKVVMTLTDYWVMCGKGILIRNNETPCMSPKEGLNCKKYCYSHLPLSRLQKRVTQGRKMFNQADALIASADFLVKLYELNKYDTSKINLIRHGFNYFDGFTPIPRVKNKFFTFSCLGSLLPHKGAHLLIQAFRQIKAPHARLKIYGEAYQPEYLKYLKELQGKDTRISFEGKYTVKDTYEIHKMTDVIVQPSTWYETYPLIGVAGLAYGVPLIVPDTTGASELVHEGENGYIFKFNDADSLAKVMAQALNDQLKLNKTIFYPHTVEEEAYLTQNVYRKVLNR